MNPIVSGLIVTHSGDDEHEDDSDNNCGPGTVYAKVEAT